MNRYGGCGQSTTTIQESGVPARNKQKLVLPKDKCKDMSDVEEDCLPYQVQPCGYQGCASYMLHQPAYPYFAEPVQSYGGVTVIGGQNRIEVQSQNTRTTIDVGPKYIHDFNQPEYQRPIAINDMMDIAEQVSGSWQELGECLGLSRNTIQTIYFDNMSSGSSEVVYQILCQWKEENSRRATVARLAKALQDIGRYDVINSMSW